MKVEINDINTLSYEIGVMMVVARAVEEVDEVE